MRYLSRFIIFIAVMMMTVVSMWTTYVSLSDSILPKPLLAVPLGSLGTWNVSIFALMLSVSIGLMLFALKLAIIGGEKKMNLLGFLGLCVVGFISISFNLDVLYRIADRDFHVRYSAERMRNVYENYLSEVQIKLNERQLEQERIVARQSGELEAEIKGLRQAPQGYGPIAKSEDYRLTVLAAQAEVELASIAEALAAKEAADELLATNQPRSLDEIEQMQTNLRVTLKDMGAIAGMALPESVRSENALFSVFRKMFDWQSIGFKEIFLLLIAIFLDLGDIVGYSMVPNRRRAVPAPGVSVGPFPTGSSPAAAMALPQPVAARPSRLRLSGHGHPEQAALAAPPVPLTPAIADEAPRPLPIEAPRHDEDEEADDGRLPMLALTFEPEAASAEAEDRQRRRDG